MFGLVGAIKELSVEELDRDDGENELKQVVDDENIEHILQRVNDAVEHSLELGNTFDGLQGPQHAQHPQRLDRAQVLARGFPPKRSIN